MIPPIIHYCWFGRGPLPALAKKCIESWKKYLPEYEIREWNEDNFDVNMIPYTAEAYKAKKYAFVSDYARFWILYKYGGLYFDTDVELIKPIDEIVSKGPFMGFENNGTTTTGVAPGLGLGVNAGLGLYKEILEHYIGEHFLASDGKQNTKTVVLRVTEIMKKYGLRTENIFQNVAGVNIYPFDYFCPIRTTDGKLCITNNTVSIHHYAASWTTPTHRFLRKLVLLIGGYRLKHFLSLLVGKSYE
ncbi:MAG: glycosyl transferase [Aeriscardovia sp.]|nr:glycosyl transferase [Aeriscardovia sp.]